MSLPTKYRKLIFYVIVTVLTTISTSARLEVVSSVNIAYWQYCTTLISNDQDIFRKSKEYADKKSIFNKHIQYYLIAYRFWPDFQIKLSYWTDLIVTKIVLHFLKSASSIYLKIMDMLSAAVLFAASMNISQWMILAHIRGGYKGRGGGVAMAIPHGRLANLVATTFHLIFS